MQRGGGRVLKGPRENQIGIRDCSLLEFSGKRLWDGDLHTRGLILIGEWKKWDWAKGECDCVVVTTKASTDDIGSSRTGTAFQSCPELWQGGQAFIPLHQFGLCLWIPGDIGKGTGHWVRWLSSAKGKLWRGTQSSTVNIQHLQHLGKMSSSVLKGCGERYWQHITVPTGWSKDGDNQYWKS